MTIKKRSRTRRPRRGVLKKAQRIVLIVVTIALPFVLTQLFFKNTSKLYWKAPAGKQSNLTEALNSTTNGTKDEEQAAEITEIEDASSAINGHWRGLCQKRSISSVEDFQRTVANDPVLSGHFSGFHWETAKIGSLEEEVRAFVTHRKGDVIKMTSKPIKLPKGDGYITDGTRAVRTFCCNDIELTPSAGVPSTEGGTVPPPATGVTEEVPPGQRFVPLAGASPSGSSGSSSPHGRIEPVPEPGTLILMGTGLLVYAALWRKRSTDRRKKGQ